MAKNPLRKAVESAERANDRLADLFARAANPESGRGVVGTPYAAARLGMTAALEKRNPTNSARQVMSALRDALETGVGKLYKVAQSDGVAEARRQLAFFEEAGAMNDATRAELEAQLDAALLATLARMDAQTATINAMLVTGTAIDTIVGDDERPGQLRPSDIVVGVAYWLAVLTWGAWEAFARHNAPKALENKVAVAALDLRTTDCCLKVTGQVQPFGKPFALTGMPRFADKINYPPFHNRCRTAVAFYQAQYDDGLTAQMRAEARQILSERAAGKAVPRNPSSGVGF